MRDVFVGEPVVAMSTLILDAEKPRFGQSLQMRAGCRRANTGQRRKLARRSSAAVEQRQKNGGTRGLGQKRAEFRELIAGQGIIHEHSLARSAPGRFVTRRNMRARARG